MSKVAVVRGENPQEATVRALEMVEAHKAIPMGKPVLVKPNYITADHPSTGVTTDSRVVEGVIMFLKKHNVANIIIGEGSGLADTFEAYRVAGLNAVAERWGVKLVDLNRGEFIEVKPLNPLALERVRISKIALESTVISVAKLKPHRMAYVTLSLKNLMGVISPKGIMHGNLSRKIVDLASILKPRVAVIDGIIAGEVHETARKPVKMNLVIAGTDPVAVDAVGAAVMGINPRTVKHLRLAEERGLGICDLKRIDVLGEPIDRVKRKFKVSILSRFFAHLG